MLKLLDAFAFVVGYGVSRSEAQDFPSTPRAVRRSPDLRQITVADVTKEKYGFR
jgi:hypothetical protein